MSEFIPADLMSNILSRLSVKSLLRIRCVSKSVCALIDSPYFINSHLRRHSTLHANSCTTIITDSVERHGLYYKQFESLDQHATKINHPFEHCGVHFLGCCNGLICLLAAVSHELCYLEAHPWVEAKLDVVLVNPATRKHRLLPVVPIEFPCCRSQTACDFIVYGFGYNSIKDDYNVVRIAQFREPKFKSEVKIYSFKLNQWRRSKDFPYRLTCTTHGVFVDGALNWLVRSCDFEDAMIASFDLETEQCRLIEPPGYLTSSYMGILRVVGRKLCVQCNYDGRHFKVWVRESYGVKEPWTELLCLEHDEDIVSLKPLALSDDGRKFLLEVEGKLVWYDLELKVMNVIRNPDIPECWRADVSLESLVKVSCDASTNLKQVQRKTKKRDGFLAKGFKLVL